MSSNTLINIIKRETRAGKPSTQIYYVVRMQENLEYLKEKKNAVNISPNLPSIHSRNGSAF